MSIVLGNGLNNSTSTQEAQGMSSHAQKQSNKLPKHAEIWALMGIHSWDTKHGGAWRLHVLATTLDHNKQCNHAAGICNGGSGKIEREKLEAAARQLGVKRSTFFSWLADARASRILSGDGKYLYIASQQRLARILLCNTIDLCKAVVPLKLLFKAGWKDIVWAAYNKANHNKKIISENKLEEITGVPTRTQRRLNTHVKRKRNIAITTKSADKLHIEREHGKHKGVFVFIDPKQGNARVLAYSLPARRTVNNKDAKTAAKGRRQIILAGIQNSVFGLLDNGNYSNYSERPQKAINGKTEFTRLFHETPKQVKKAGRMGQAQSRAKHDPSELFTTRSRRYVVGAWDVISLADSLNI